MTDQLWKPDRVTRAAIRRGDKLHREFFKRKSFDYQLALIGRLIAHQALNETRYGCDQ
jgi:hypothetical protein